MLGRVFDTQSDGQPACNRALEVRPLCGRSHESHRSFRASPDWLLPGPTHHRSARRVAWRVVRLRRLGSPPRKSRCRSNNNPHPVAWRSDRLRAAGRTCPRAVVGIHCVRMRDVCWCAAAGTDQWSGSGSRTSSAHHGTRRTGDVCSRNGTRRDSGAGSRAGWSHAGISMAAAALDDACCPAVGPRRAW
jgi:hypothetical protein